MKNRELSVAQDFHKTLLNEHGRKAKLDRSTFDKALCIGYGLGITQAARVTRTGEVHNFWRRVRGEGFPPGVGYVELLPGSKTNLKA